MKKNTLGGCLFVYRGVQHDYCFMDTIACLKELCDQVVVVDCGSDDGTVNKLKTIEDENTLVVYLDKSEWEKQQGKEKISYFQNFASQFLITDYYIVLQADEIIGRESFPYIRDGIERGFEGLSVTRINLWKDSQHKLIVPHDRQPCGTHIIRIAKLGYLSVDDGEGIDCPNAIANYAPHIKIWHMGFVRNKYVMKEKVRHMQEDVFKINHDPKLDKADYFKWDEWFSESDLEDIKGPLPEFIQEWAETRDKINNTNQQ